MHRPETAHRTLDKCLASPLGLRHQFGCLARGYKPAKTVILLEQTSILAAEITTKEHVQQQQSSSFDEKHQQAHRHKQQAKKGCSLEDRERMFLLLGLIVERLVVHGSTTYLLFARSVN